MKIKTNLPHEETLGGRTEIAFLKPYKISLSDNVSIVSVDMHIVKVIASSDEPYRVTYEIIQHQLTKGQKKRVQLYAKELAQDHAKKSGMGLSKKRADFKQNAFCTGFNFYIKKNL
jgi:hypothetical protein